MHISGCRFKGTTSDRHRCGPGNRFSCFPPASWQHQSLSSRGPPATDFQISAFTATWNSTPPQTPPAVSNAIGLPGIRHPLAPCLRHALRQNSINCTLITWGCRCGLAGLQVMSATGLYIAFFAKATLRGPRNTRQRRRCARGNFPTRSPPVESGSVPVPVGAGSSSPSGDRSGHPLLSIWRTSVAARTHSGWSCWLLFPITVRQFPQLLTRSAAVFAL